jgi:hypothetical protein
LGTCTDGCRTINISTHFPLSPLSILYCPFPPPLPSSNLFRKLAEVPAGIQHGFNNKVEPYSICPTIPESMLFLKDLYSQVGREERDNDRERKTQRDKERERERADIG